MVECRTPEREVGGSKPTAAVLCPCARHFTPRKHWLITQEAVAPSRHDWKIVDWDVKPQHNQPLLIRYSSLVVYHLVDLNLWHPNIRVKKCILTLFNISREIHRLDVRILRESIRKILRKCDRWTPLRTWWHLKFKIIDQWAYCPLHCFKILERSLEEQLMNILKRFLTHTCLLSESDLWGVAERGGHAGAILMDLSKPFDCLPHLW